VLQVQDSTGSDDELDTPTLTKTTMICKLEQILPKILMMLPVEAKNFC
jgi:hypothetical protein